MGDFESVTGLGVQGTVNGRVWRVGSSGFFDGPIPQIVETIAQTGKTPVLVGTEGHIAGVISVADTPRPGAADMIRSLTEGAGLHVAMLTGDDPRVAQSLAEELGLRDWRASLLPQEKVEAVADLRRRFGEVAVVGDGVNDAPAMASASVGIAMGAAGSDAALETADVALMGDDLSKLPYLFRLSKAARRVIRQNVLASIVVKSLLVVGVFPGYVSLVVAVLVGDMGTSLAVTVNALRLARLGDGRRKHPEK